RKREGKRPILANTDFTKRAPVVRTATTAVPIDDVGRTERCYSRRSFGSTPSLIVPATLAAVR
ncbi:MAG: hypothetical protein ACI91T_000456, partial [Natronomonas sp.]